MPAKGNAKKPAPAKKQRKPTGVKLTPKTTSKKLPWLDGKVSSVVSSTPPARDTSSVATVLRPGDPRPIEPPTGPGSPNLAAVRTIGSAPLLQRNSLNSSNRRRGLSEGASSQSPDPTAIPSRPPRHSRHSVANRASSPITEEGPPHLPPQVEDPFGDDRVLPNSSLSPIPVHLDGSPSSPHAHPHPHRKPVERSAHAPEAPAFITSAQLSPTQPIPDRSPFESAGDLRRLSNAIEGLEGLVQEAVGIVGGKDQGQVQEVYEIIEEATKAIHEASVLPAQHLMATTSPLGVSEASEEEAEFWHSSEESVFSPEPPRVAPGGPAQRTLLDHPDRQKGSEAIDWAYEDNKARTRRAPFSSSSSSEDSSDTPRRLSAQSDLLLPPQHIQPAPRERVDFVLRPTKTEELSRGSMPRHRVSNSDPRVKSRPPKRVSWSNSPSSGDEGIPSLRPRPQGSRGYNQQPSVRHQTHHHPHTFSLRRHHRRQPIARNWSTGQKRITATIACINTALLGIIVGIYAGEVPRIQYVLADERHHVIVGNVVLYFGLAISTFVSWPLPLLHGRKPYILASLALALPLQFPQALVVSAKRSPNKPVYVIGLLVSRALTGLVLGFANVNFITVLLDLFGASLQSKNPHQEIVVVNDVRRHGGGMGMWIGIWSWCSIGSLAVGFQIGAAVIENMTPDWGFYIVVIILVAALFLNILAPETRRSTYRMSVTEVYDRDENFITRRVARGEVKLHIGTEGPKYWFEEVWAGMKLTVMMCLQPGFAVLAVYLGWIYTQIVLVIVLLGALLSRDYRWYPRYVGLGVMSIAIGAFLAIPLTKAGIFSRDRKNSFRTDSMTFEKQLSWSSHLVRRFIFTLTLPLMGVAYTVSSAGRPKPYMVPIAFAGAVGFLSILAIAECIGLIMETFDTCDLQPGVNTKHRLQSMAVQDRRRRTNYSSFPRVTAGIFASQTFAFIGAAVATEVGGIMTRHIGAQASTGVTSGILLALTILLTAVLWRFQEVQVIPHGTFGTRRDTKAWEEFKEIAKDDWKAVVIGNPSGKMRRMSALELGGLSRWTEIRKLNFLIRDDKGKASRAALR